MGGAEATGGPGLRAATWWRYGRAVSTPEEPRRGRNIDEWFGSATTIAGGIAALAGFVYFVGGMVMWLRFRTADLPPDQGVALMSREQLFVVGLRLMIIPTLVTGTIAALLAHRAAHQGESGRGLLGWVVLAVLAILAALLPVWSFAVAGWPAELAVLLGALIVVGGFCIVVTLRRADDDGDGGRFAKLPRWLAPATAGTAAALVLVLTMAVPGLEVDDRLWARFAVAAAALLAMALPAVLVVAPRLPRPPARAWLAVPVLAVAVVAVLTPSWGGRLAVVLGALVVAGALTAAVVLLDGRGQVAGQLKRWAPAALAIVAVGMVVPWSFASATWPLGLAIVIAVWLWQRPRLLQAATAEEAATQRRRVTIVMAAAAVFAAAVVSIGRQLDEPVQLLQATVTFKETSETVEGAYVNASGDTVYIGDQDGGRIQAIPRSEVREVSVGPPEERAPSPSLLSRMLPGKERFSARPLEVWCDGERYGWLEAGKLCETQPDIYFNTRNPDRFLDRLGMPVYVKCPLEARDICRGWVHLRSRSDYVHGRTGVARPVVPEPVPFAVSQGKTTEVCATITAGQLRLLRRVHGEKVAWFEAVLAQDPERETVLDEEPYGLVAGRNRILVVSPKYSACRPRLGLKESVGEDGVNLTVTARPSTRGIRPWDVEGWIRLSATRGGEPAEPPDGPAREREAEPIALGERELENGAVRFPLDLPPGPWVITARYRSVAGLRHIEPSPEIAIEIPRLKRSA